MSNRFEKSSKLTLTIVLLISSIIILIVFEKLVGTTLGLTEEQVRHIRLREHSPMLDKTMSPISSDLKETDGLVDKPYAFATDEHGFIKPSLIHQNPDLIVAFIGGSTTECMHVDVEKRFPYLTGKLLSSNKLKVNSINAGVSGNDSLNSINAYTNKILPLKPDIAVLMHNINDLSILLYEGSYWNHNKFRSPIIQEDKSVKAFLKTILPNTYEFLFRIKANITGHVDEFSAQRGSNKVIDQKRIQELFESNLKIFIEISKAKAIQPVLMTQANRFLVVPDANIADNAKSLESIGIKYTQYKALYDAMNESIRKVSKDNDVLLIDLAKEVPQTSKYMVDSVHFNDLGSELVARIIAEHLETLLAKSNSE